MNLKVIKTMSAHLAEIAERLKETHCQCGAVMVSMTVEHGDHPEQCQFACGLELVVRGGNPTNYAVEILRRCPKSADQLAEKERWRSARVDLLYAIAKSTLLPAEKDRLVSHVLNEIDWRLR